MPFERSKRLVAVPFMYANNIAVSVSTVGGDYSNLGSNYDDYEFDAVIFFLQQNRRILSKYLFIYSIIEYLGSFIPHDRVLNTPVAYDLYFNHKQFPKMQKLMYHLFCKVKTSQ